MAEPENIKWDTVGLSEVHKKVENRSSLKAVFTYSTKEVNQIIILVVEDL